MQNREISTEVRNMSIGDMEAVVKVTFRLTGAKSIQEVEEQLNSRFNNTDTVKVNAIPLGDWCKDNNYNRLKVFNLLRKDGYITSLNELTEEGIGDLHDLELGGTLSMEDIVLFNTYTTGNGTKTVMVNPSSKYLENLIDALEPLKQTGYRGSKGYDMHKVCQSMKQLCGSYKIVG